MLAAIRFQLGESARREWLCCHLLGLFAGLLRNFVAFARRRHFLLRVREIDLGINLHISRRILNRLRRRVHSWRDFRQIQPQYLRQAAAINGRAICALSRNHRRRHIKLAACFAVLCNLVSQYLVVDLLNPRCARHGLVSRFLLLPCVEVQRIRARRLVVLGKSVIRRIAQHFRAFEFAGQFGTLRFGQFRLLTKAMRCTNRHLPGQRSRQQAIPGHRRRSFFFRTRHAQQLGILSLRGHAHLTGQITQQLGLID